MVSQKLTALIFILLFAAPAGATPARARRARGPNESRTPEYPVRWQTPARLRHTLGSTRGTISFDARGIVFSPWKGKPLRWSFVQIHTFRVTRRDLALTSYRNRGWHLPGEKSFHFELGRAMTPAEAAALVERVGKPAKNADPNSSLPSFAVIPARHPMRFGGTNGELHFRNEGIDYVTSTNSGSRSWRWKDIQTIARPNPYHFRVGAYREAFDFDLKRPMSRALFDRLWDSVYGRDLLLSTGKASQDASGQVKEPMTKALPDTD